MNHHTIFTAAALLAAPVCLVAQAKTFEESLEEGIAVMNELSALLEKTTPDNADEIVAELEQMSERMNALKAEEANYTDEEKARILQNPEVVSKLQAPMQRFIMALMNFQNSLQSATPEQQAELQKVMTKIQSLKP